MRTLRLRRRLLLLPWPLLLLALAGCASTRGIAPKIKTVASVGDKALPVVTGTPGNSVAADRVRPERRVSTNGRLSGRVVDDRGEPVPNVRVRLAVGNAPGGRMIRATTDASGAFTLHGLRPGSEYTVIAEHEDNQGLLTGRADARAPDTDVQISLKADDGDAGLAGGGARVSPVSNREERDEPSEGDGRPSARYNAEDLEPPPAEEADDLPRATLRQPQLVAPPRQSAARPRAAGWHRGALARDTTEAAPVDPETHGTSAPETPEPAAPVEDEEDANPLPPALEPGQVSRFDPVPVDPFREPAPADLRSFAVAPPVASEADFEPAPPAEAPRPAIARAPEPEPGALVVSPSTADVPAEPPPAADPAELPPPVDALASSGGSELPPPVVELPEPAPPEAVASATGPPGPVPTDAPQRRPRWGELAATSATPMLAAEDVTPPRVLDASTFAPARAEEPVFCRYDASLRFIDDFQLPDAQGKPVRFQDFDADLILLDFWGSGCEPCLRSVPHLVALQRRFGPKQLQVVGIACDEGATADRRDQILQAAERLKINYPILVSGIDGDCPVLKALGVTSFPTLILADRHGRIVWRGEGATTTTLARLDQFLASAPPSETTRRF